MAPDLQVKPITESELPILAKPTRLRFLASVEISPPFCLSAILFLPGAGLKTLVGALSDHEETLRRRNPAHQARRLTVLLSGRILPGLSFIISSILRMGRASSTSFGWSTRMTRACFFFIVLQLSEPERCFMCRLGGCRSRPSSLDPSCRVKRIGGFDHLGVRFERL
ncbi:hypothetical protein MUK42_06028 [Musa troglodytarum]|uniref:Uncharacterized protein n=1 Tax=Musa troglodytarum TaxID=320322 RepID=A0A9E7HCN6_9LILI|nr:hypothetical protein MUK42_06028 [Musa troglodytarum]